MELHSQALNFLCRLCGGKVSKNSHNKFELKRKLEKVCDIDVSDDTKLLNPPKVCDTCRHKLDRKYKEKQKHKEIKTNSIPALQWIAHLRLKYPFHSRKNILKFIVFKHICYPFSSF